MFPLPIKTVQLFLKNLNFNFSKNVLNLVTVKIEKNIDPDKESSFELNIA